MTNSQPPDNSNNGSTNNSEPEAPSTKKRFGQRIKSWFAKFKPKKVKPVAQQPLPAREVQSEVHVNPIPASPGPSSNNLTAQPLSNFPSQSSVDSTDTTKSAVVTVPVSPVIGPKSYHVEQRKPDNTTTVVAKRNDITIFETIMTRIIPARTAKKKKKRRSLNKKQLTPRSKIIKNQVDVWKETEIGQPFPDPEMLIMALFQPIESLEGENRKQYVACRYLHGNPVLGRAWDDNGKLVASFTSAGREYKLVNNAVSVLLLKKPTGADAFVYDWRTFAESVSYDEFKIWHPVVLGSTKGNISPAVIPVNEKLKILGQADVRNERASYGHRGIEKEIVGPEVRNTIILCRKKF